MAVVAVAVVVAVAAGAVTVDVVLAGAVTPAAGVWEDERVRTGVSGGDWLPAVADSSGALATTRATAWEQSRVGLRQVCWHGLHTSQFSGKPPKARNDQHIQCVLRRHILTVSTQRQSLMLETHVSGPWGTQMAQALPSRSRLDWGAASVLFSKVRPG